MKTSYKIVQTVNGTMIVTCPADIYAWAELNDRKASYIPDCSAGYLRPELRNKPRIQGLCGPMYDGEKDGVAIVRYEDQETFNQLSA